MVDDDYRRQLQASYIKQYSKFIIKNAVEGTWRLRDDDYKGEGFGLRANISFEQKPSTSSKVIINTNYSAGNYDYNILQFNNDRVVDNYTYIGLDAYVEKKIKLFKGNGYSTIAGEIISQKTDLSNADSGTSMVGYLDIEIPLHKKIDANLICLGVSGSDIPKYPSGNLKTAVHSELTYKISNDISFKTGYTVRPDEEQTNRNLYVVLSALAGVGNFRLVIGQGTLPGSTDPMINLPGSFATDGCYYPVQALRGRAWEGWDNDNFYALQNKKFVSTENTWDKYITVRYWYEF